MKRNKEPVQRRQFPHCDQRVLHPPSSCEFCDMSPDLQQLRIDWGINFTGEEDPSKAPCPAEFQRPKSRIDRWGGNVAKPLLSPESITEHVSVVTVTGSNGPFTSCSFCTEALETGETVYLLKLFRNSLPQADAFVWFHFGCLYDLGRELEVLARVLDNK